jgi:calcium-dependent protein kinase
MIVHRDLKPENVLLEANKEFDQIKIIDFGTSLQVKEGEKLDEKLGTPYYIAPEVL